MSKLNGYSQVRLNAGSPILAGTAIAVVAVLSGVVIGLGNPILQLLFFGLLFGVALLASKTLLMWAVLFGGLVVTGLAELYVPQLRAVRWAVVAASGLMAVLALVSSSGTASRWDRGMSVANPLARPEFWAAAFMVSGCISILINIPRVLEAVVGIKAYFQAVGIFLALAYLPFSGKQVDSFAKGFLYLGIVQVPFALHQFLVLVPQRTSTEMASHLVVAPDVVAGTFVASMTGGGGSAILATLQVAIVIGLAAAWRGGLVGRVALAVLSAWLLVPVALNETKIALVLLPLGIAFVFRDQMTRNFFRYLAGLTAAAGVVATLAVGYAFLPRAEGQRAASVTEYFEKSMAYNFGDRGYGAWQLNRTTVYPFWLENHGLVRPAETLFGHGLGASKEGGGVTGADSLAARQYYGYGIGLTAAAALLWDTGLLGSACALGLFVSSFLTGLTLLRERSLGVERRTYVTCATAAIPMLGVGLLHNNFFVFELGFQCLFWFAAGYLLAVRRQLSLGG